MRLYTQLNEWFLGRKQNTNHVVSAFSGVTDVQCNLVPGVYEVFVTLMMSLLHVLAVRQRQVLFG